MRDLTHEIETGMQTYPGDPAVSVTPAATVETDGYAVRRVELGSHAGTHVDAPAHVLADGRTLASFDPETFVFDAVRVDCRDLGAREAVPADRVPTDTDADCVVFDTGWADHWGAARYRDHPYLAPAAGRACAEAGLAVATDTLSPDPTPPADHGSGGGSEGGSHHANGDENRADEPDGVPVHEAVLGAERPIVENLTGLAGLDRFELRALPLALDGDGAPVRAVAVESSSPTEASPE
ncbi:cyclase family protein [Halobaculum sp. MBLA0143]|uniref:cyclase family protein n=1 Tax=Halobaculum sp. MBLA0143 TaxID=3079933 RepID=UPI003523B3A6